MDNITVIAHAKALLTPDRPDFNSGVLALVGKLNGLDGPNPIGTVEEIFGNVPPCGIPITVDGPHDTQRIDLLEPLARISQSEGIDIVLEEDATALRYDVRKFFYHRNSGYVALLDDNRIVTNENICDFEWVNDMYDTGQHVDAESYIAYLEAAAKDD